MPAIFICGILLIDMNELLGNQGYITEIDIRTFLQDNVPENNILLDDFEFTPEDIRSAQTFIIDKWNETPPPVGIYRFDTFPYRYHLLKGVVGHLLISKSLNYLRNHLDYNISGGQINDKARWSEYYKIGASFLDEFNQWMEREKVRLNAEQGWGFDG